jgi:hypothetical protein
MNDTELIDGRALVRTNLWRIFFISACVAWIASRSTGSAAWMRLIVIGLVCLLVYRGLRWALWLLGALTLLAGLMMIGVALARPELHWTNRYLFAAAGVVQVLAFVILLKAPEARQFMEHQRHLAAQGSDIPPEA